MFVSYAHEDRVRAQALIQVLERAGFRIWWDGLIVGGAAFAHSTEQALESAGAVVVLWSAASSTSHWVRDEATRGRDRGCLVPVSLDGSQPPLGFRQYLVIDLSAWSARADAPETSALLQAIRAAQGQAAPGPTPAYAPVRVDTTRRRLLLAAGSFAAVAVGTGAWFGSRRWSAPTALEANGIAVLPFANLSGDPAQTYFADGVAAEVRGALAHNPRLQVIAQVSCDAFRDAKSGAVNIARSLGVAHLLDGNVRRSGATFRISAELIDGRSGFSRWSQSFDRSIDDIFAVESEIAHAVDAALKAQLTGATAVAAPAPAPVAFSGSTTNVVAFDAYLRGRAAYLLSEGETSDRDALAEFDAAIAADPGFAAAHAARSRTLIVIANEYTDSAQTKDLYDAAIRAAATATTLAPDYAQGHSALGFARLYGRLDMRGARAPYDRSRELGTGDATVLGLFALYAGLMARFGDALPAISRAAELDPLNPLVHVAEGTIRYSARRYGDSIKSFERGLALNPKLSNAHARIGMALTMLGRDRDAREHFQTETHDLLRLTGLAIVEHRLGAEAAARSAANRLRQDLGDRALYQQAQVEAQWGHAETALGLLVRARTLGDSGLTFARTDPLLDPLRQLPAFGTMLRQLGFDDA